MITGFILYRCLPVYMEIIFFCLIVCLLVYWVFYLFTFQMLSLSRFPLPPPPASMKVLPYQLTHSHLTSLTFLYTGAWGLHMTKGLPSH